MGGASAKVLLAESNQRQYRNFILSSEDDNNDILSVPALSAVPWIGASRRRDVYKRELSHQASHHIKFITKNGTPHSFLWQTDSEKLKQGVRWGIVKTHSITSKVIASLGQYRIVAHERVMKGMVSNSQTVKLKLLDLYQDRFSALQGLESLVSNNNTLADYEKAFERYFLELQKIEEDFDSYFSEVDCTGLNEQAFKQMKSDLVADKARTQTYLDSLRSSNNLRAYNRSRGKDSILEFVKQQMIHGLYEFQGINQDMSYSRTRRFALTRGEINDFIEDARKEIDDHVADARNAVTEKHHGNYGDGLTAYDFSRDNLTAAREQHVLMAVSFIEGWDVLEHKKGQKPVVHNKETGEHETLDIYAATRWKTHRNFRTAAKSFGYFLLNIVKGIFVSTRPWDEEAWGSKEFHLTAIRLRKYVKPIEPMWKKPIYFLKQIGFALVDMVNGIRDFGSHLIIKMPGNLVNDWESSKELPALDKELDELTQTSMQIERLEQETLTAILKWCEQDPSLQVSQPKAQLASVEYELSSGEYNDILNSVARGISSFSSVFTHNIYAKDPVGGLVFTTTYLAGIGMIYLPAYSASLFGNAFVNAFNNVSYAMASSSMGAAIAGGSTLAQVSAVAWDGVTHGPSGIAVNALYQCGEDPLTIGAYCAAAYGLGYLLANGIAGHQIPWLSHVLQEDLGTDPSTGYPLIGAKFAVMLYEALAVHHEPQHEQPHLLQPDVKREQQVVQEFGRKMIDRFKLVNWLSVHAKVIPKLEDRQKFALARQIDHLFSKAESESLKKLLYPESHPSIAFQIFAVPLAYIPVVLRFLISPFISLAAVIKKNPHPAEPMNRAFEALFDKIKKDLSRLIVLTTNVTYLFYSLASAFIKMLAYLGTMAIGRVAGLFDANPAHTLHRVFASIHTFIRSIGEYFYPARAMKSVASSHPTDTMLKTEKSYNTLLQQMGKGAARDENQEAGVAQNEHFASPLDASGTSDTQQTKNLIAVPGAYSKHSASG